jgi:hypothetical protein
MLGVQHDCAVVVPIPGVGYGAHFKNGGRHITGRNEEGDGSDGRWRAAVRQPAHAQSSSRANQMRCAMLSIARIKQGQIHQPASLERVPLFWRALSHLPDIQPNAFVSRSRYEPVVNRGRKPCERTSLSPAPASKSKKPLSFSSACPSLLPPPAPPPLLEVGRGAS